jgi:hypothetical protein
MDRSALAWKLLFGKIALNSSASFGVRYDWPRAAHRFRSPVLKRRSLDANKEIARSSRRNRELSRSADGHNRLGIGEHIRQDEAAIRKTDCKNDPSCQPANECAGADDAANCVCVEIQHGVQLSLKLESWRSEAQLKYHKAAPCLTTVELTGASGKFFPPQKARVLPFSPLNRDAPKSVNVRLLRGLTVKCSLRAWARIDTTAAPIEPLQRISIDISYGYPHIRPPLTPR